MFPNNNTLCVSSLSLKPPEMSKVYPPFACSAFQKDCAIAYRSDNQPRVMSERALIPPQVSENTPSQGVCSTL